MMETINCVYETPCGLCSKRDKKCDKKIKSIKPLIKRENKMVIEVSENELENIILSLYESKNFFYWKRDELDKLGDRLYKELFGGQIDA